ncbi:2-succinyl-5-enolpyruvyl-6-hydroxy-3-cyclohexene-1-carboxylic-acid synthase [Corynebacterium mendelii]|uniref:2-succinyl-5-enolpyruvyl-6-hydroxy-3-cyclohexene-1-carboxylate synthase n=1 Tax=Corynebacterium mendelii TaxID=2765362 RepID=A0A939DZX7_9CORY|nr:2-succinyl-5-enolpyruvyl-6-hydroxy-3-cyclohexene-1-carboxylic-acid synthase [Corynebacterium mendelii]MBN9643904.1 2-succinyl-5-enolpyruvyl-6-hydroxy-3-cyclohexene-1-carboxylic-acid synthase [Corynebacterium mendelii]
MPCPSAAAARLLVDEFIRCGITEWMVCPGSRSAPLALAVAAAERAGQLRVHTRADERAAAFCALGIARVTGRPVPVVVTSGTAPAHCHPAMIEAHTSGIPLLVVSADRPARLVGTGASQTIDQAGVFGRFADCISLTAESLAAGGAQAARAAVRRALAAGQAQINIGFDTPLIDRGEPPAGQAVADQPGRLTITAPRHDWGGAEIDISGRTLVIAGDAAPAVPGLAGVPTIAEPSASAPDHPVHPLAAGFMLSGVIGGDGRSVPMKPEQIIVTGHPTLHRPVMALLADPDIAVTVLTDRAQPTDPAGAAERIVSRITTRGEVPAAWRTATAAASGLAAEAVRGVVARTDLGFTGLHAAAAVADSLNTGDTLFAGASNPVRDLSWVGLPFEGVATYAQRGVAGIDGSIGQAAGIAMAVGRRQPDTTTAPRTVALLGDVTFLHDIGSLLIPADGPAPDNLTIVVADDHGGGIFESLEPGRPGLRDSFEKYFALPHTADLVALARGFGHTACEVANLTELVEALISTTATGSGITVIVARTDRHTRPEINRAIAAAVGAADH